MTRCDLDISARINIIIIIIIIIIITTTLTTNIITSPTTPPSSSYALAECFGTGFPNNINLRGDGTSNDTVHLAHKARHLQHTSLRSSSLILRFQVDNRWVFRYSDFVSPASRSCDCTFGYKARHAALQHCQHNIVVVHA